jgi:ABC-type dipeptide/oligopeptide/nickel transport system permease component
MMHAIPGGPFDESKMPLSEAAKAKLKAQYGLDKPLIIQYLNYMKNALKFQFGYSYQSPGETITELLGRTWKVSALLGGLGLLIAFPLGIGLGIISAVRRNSIIDYLTTVVSIVGITVPVFVTSMVLILLFAIWFKWFPSGGWGEIKHIILPAIAYAALPTGTIARYTRSSLLEVLTKPFITTLRAKGLSERNIILKHALKNAAIPLLTIALPMFTGIMTGSIFVEKLFRVPGLGKFFVSSIMTRDYPLMMTLILLVAFMLGITYLITDILYAWVDPRMRIGDVE